MKTEKYEMRNGEIINIPIPTSYADCVTLIKSDYYRIFGKKDNLFVIWLKSFRDRALKHMFWLRLSSYRGCLFLICKLRHEHYKVKYDCLLHSDAKIGYGLYIGHAMSMCINRNCIIGNNVNLPQMCNIGTNNKNQAIIGDNVYIGPMSCLVEGVHIGSNTTIGAGSVVTRDIPSNTTAVGVPCKPIGANKHPEYVQNRWTV